MKFFTKVFIILFLSSLFLTNIQAYSYSSAGQEPTLDAQDGILNAINKNDFTDAKNIFNTYKKNYKYLNDEFNKKLYTSLSSAIQTKNKANIIKWLRISISLEIERRLDGGLKNIDNFTIAKPMIVKANKFYKILSGSLEYQINKKLKKAILNCSKSIGNPGLFGIGQKNSDIVVYKKNQKIVIDILKSL